MQQFFLNFTNFLNLCTIFYISAYFLSLQTFKAKENEFLDTSSFLSGKLYLTIFGENDNIQIVNSLFTLINGEPNFQSLPKQNY